MKPYDTYKDSGIEWIGEIPSHWEVKRFKYLFSFVNDKCEMDLPKVGLEHIESWTGRKIENDTEFEGEGTYFQKGDILFGKLRPYLAKVYLADFEGKAVGDFFVFRPQSNVDIAFGHKFILSRNFIDITNSSTFGSKMPRVSPDFINELKSILPPLAEQTAIAYYLDRKTVEIDALIADKKRLLEFYEEEKTTLINQAVTKGIDPKVKMKDSGVEWLGEIPEHWETSRLKYLGKFINGYSFKSTDFSSSGVRVLKISNIQHMRIDWSDASFIDDSFYESFKNFRVLKNDLVFALTRPIISSGIKVALVDISEPILLNQRNSIYRPTNINVKWIYYILLSTAFIEEFDSKIDKTGQQPNISSNDIGEIVIPVLEEKEQNAIIEFIDKQYSIIQNKVVNTQKLIELLTEYRTALISEVVTGKINIID